MKNLLPFFLILIHLQCSDASKGILPLFGLGSPSSSEGGISTSVSENATLKSIQISPATIELTKDLEQEFTATAIYSDGSKVEITSDVRWEIQDPGMVSLTEISNDSASSKKTSRSNKFKKIKALTQGETKLKATLNGIMGEARISINDSTITKVEFDQLPTIPTKQNVPVQAAAILSNDKVHPLLPSSISISSQSTADAEIDPNGNLTSHTAGDIILVATIGGQAATTTVHSVPDSIRSIQIEGTTSLVKGLKSQLKAFAIYESGARFDVTGQVVWTSEDGNSKIESENSPGLLEAVSQGETKIRAALKNFSTNKTITVTAPKIVSISLEQNGNAPLGLNFPYKAIASFDDGSSSDVTAQVTWESENPSIVSISNSENSSGQAHALGVGETRITATIGGISASTFFRSTPAIVRSLSLTNPGSLALGLQNQFSAIATYSDGSTKNVSSETHWSITGPGEISTLSQFAGNFKAVQIGTTKIVASFGGITASTNLEITPAKLTSLSISPQNSSLPKGFSRNFQVMGIFSDGTKRDLTGDATWIIDSNDDEIGDTIRGSIGNSPETMGKFIASGEEGSGKIIALIQGIKASTNIQITSAELISISMDKPEYLISGLGGKIRATGIYSDGTTRDITSNLSYNITGNVFIQPETGIVTAGSSGSSSITAYLGDKSISFNLTIKPAELQSITILPPPEIIPKGVITELRAIGTFTDGTKSDITANAQWLTNNMGGIETAPGGKVFFKGNGLGSASVKSIYGGKEGSTSYTISPAVLTSISIESVPSIAAGLSLNLKAVGTFSDLTTQDITSQVIWKTTGKAIADNSLSLSGILKTIEQENLGVSATLGGITQSKTIQVLAPSIKTLQLNLPEISLANGTSKSISVSAILSDGSVRDVTPDAVFIADSNGDGINDDNVITVSNSNPGKGEIKAKSAGNAELKIIVGGESITKTVNVTPATLVALSLGEPRSIASGISLEIKAIGTYSDNSTQDLTNQISWTVNGGGSVFGSGSFLSLLTGIHTVTATFNGFSATKSISVLPPEIKSLSISGANLLMAKGTTDRLRVSGLLTDGSTTDLTSQASFLADSNGDGLNDSSVVSIGNLGAEKGIITANGIGLANVLISVNGKLISTSIIVKPAELVSISILPSPESIPLGTEVQFSATGFYTDGTHQNLTDSVTWTLANPDGVLNPVPSALIGSTSSESIASISNGLFSKGKLSTAGVGSLSIIASLNSINGKIPLTIRAAEIVELTINSPNSSIPKGLNENFTASGKYTDNIVRDLTNQVTWSSDSNGDGVDDKSVFSISNEPLLKGNGKALFAGTTIIRASISGKSASKSITVLPAIPVSLSVESVNQSRPKGLPETFIAIATYSDGSQLNVGSSVSWIADSNGDGKNDTAVVSISNSIDSKGTITTLNPGSVRVIGSLGALSTSINFTVLPAVLQSISIQPDSASIAKGFQRQFSASGTYSDGTKQDITAGVTWKADSDNNGLDDSLIASISNQIGKNGMVEGNKGGSSKITASLSGISSNTSTVTILDSTTLGSGSDPRLQIEEVSNTSLPFNFQGFRNLGIQAVVTDPNGSTISGALVEFYTGDESGLLFSQLTSLDGRITGSALIQSSESSIVAVITRGTSIQKITIPVQREMGTEIRLVVNILGIQIQSGSGNTTVVDTDKDGVPDSKDIYPNDATRAFKIRIPSTGAYTITFEDKYPSKGDSDLNDYVAYVVFEEDTNAAGNVVEIRSRIQHVARGAIDNTHLLNWKIPSSVSVSKYSTVIYNGDGNNINKGTTLTNPTSKNLSIFNNLDSTETLPWQWWGIIYRPVYNVYDCPLGINCFESGYIAMTNIRFTEPIRRDVIGTAPYDIYLQIKGTSTEIHFPGLYITNGKDQYLDNSGFPWAILITGNFKWPKLTIPSTTIYTAYPDFNKWATSKGTTYKTWYQNPNSSKIYTDASVHSLLMAK